MDLGHVEIRPASVYRLPFPDGWYEKVRHVLIELNLQSDPDVLLIDARDDHKPSGSKAKISRSSASIPAQGPSGSS
jgi:hypothetical protein